MTPLSHGALQQALCNNKLHVRLFAPLRKARSAVVNAGQRDTHKHKTKQKLNF